MELLRRQLVSRGLFNEDQHGAWRGPRGFRAASRDDVRVDQAPHPLFEVAPCRLDHPL